MKRRELLRKLAGGVVAAAAVAKAGSESEADALPDSTIHYREFDEEMGAYRGEVAWDQKRWINPIRIDQHLPLTLRVSPEMAEYIRASQRFDRAMADASMKLSLRNARRRILKHKMEAGA